MFKYFKIVCKAGYLVLSQSRFLTKINKHKDEFSLIDRYNYSHDLIVKVCEKLDCLFIVNNKENLIQDSNCLFICNHQSNMDALSFLAVIEKPLTFLSKIEVLKFPYVRKVLKAIDGIFMDRKDFRSEIRCLMQVTSILKKGEQSVVIFPEGTRSKDGLHTLNEFKPGSLKPAFNSNKPIQLVAIYGGFRVLDKKLKLKKYPIQISFLNPIYPSEFKGLTTIELSKIIEDKIANEVDRLRQIDKELVLKYSYRNSKNNFDIAGI